MRVPRLRFAATTPYRGATRARVAATLFGLMVVLIADATPDGLLPTLRNAVFDTYQRDWPSPRPAHPILVIDIDSQSIRRLGQWPWPRDKLARLVEIAAAARVIGIDLLLTEPDRLGGGNHETDALLTASLRRVPVVLAAAAAPAGELPLPPVFAATPVFEAGPDPRADLPHYRSVAWPYAPLAGAAKGIGLVTVPAEVDGIIRRMPTIASVGPVLVPSFGVEVMRLARRTDRIGLTTEPNGEHLLEIGGKVILTDQAGEVWPHYSTNAPVLSLPADRVLSGEITPAVFRDRVVLIGSSAPGLADAFETPLQRLESGVLIQAQFIHSLLAGELLRRPNLAPAFEWLFAAALALTAMLLFGEIADKAYAFFASGAVILSVAGSLGAFAVAGLLLDPTLPLTAFLVTNLVVLAERSHREALTRRQREIELAGARREAVLRGEAERARESLAIALDAARMGSWDADLVRGTARRSPRYVEIFGRTRAETRWSREALLASVVAEDRDSAARSLDAALRTGTLHFQCSIRQSDGSLRAIVVDGRVYHAEDGRPIRIAGVVMDVTERRRMEEILQQQQRLQAVGTIAGGVAHNFNNLLTNILGNLDLAARHGADPVRLSGYLGTARAAAERGADLTWQLLSFAGQQPLQPQPVELSGQLRVIAKLIAETFPEEIRVETDIPSDLGIVEIDRGEFQLALINLALNARDAMAAGGALRIAARTLTIRDARLGLDGHYVVIEIADNGTGIPAGMLPTVFEPFVTTKEIGAGVGLGLSQVHGFVNQSGGAVDIDSEPGKGTAVRMYLPAAHPVATASPGSWSRKGPGDA
jgi:CHASE2 domain-containing sensor protein/nitrogen-specific signal transduction histidine kinase